MLENFTNKSITDAIEYGYDRRTVDFSYRLVFPGSFNLLHSGHIELMLHALKHFWKRKDKPLHPTFELSKTNCDKPDIDDEEIIKRVRVITKAGFQVIVTNHPTFTQKNRLFRQSRFILGFDTFTRMLDLKHYYNNRNLLLINLLYGQSDYLVYPRGFANKESYANAIDKEMTRFQDKPEFINRFHFVDFDTFKQNDISSTEIRKMKDFGDD